MTSYPLWARYFSAASIARACRFSIMCLLTVSAAPVAALWLGRAHGFPRPAREEAKRAGTWVCPAVVFGFVLPGVGKAPPQKKSKKHRGPCLRRGPVRAFEEQGRRRAGQCCGGVLGECRCGRLGLGKVRGASVVRGWSMPTNRCCVLKLCAKCKPLRSWRGARMPKSCRAVRSPVLAMSQDGCSAIASADSERAQANHAV